MKLEEEGHQYDPDARRPAVKTRRVVAAVVEAHRGRK